jgi:hypothetical protein
MVVFSDAFNHASMSAGIRNSRAEEHIFRHYDPSDLGVCSRADNLAFVPGTAYEDYWTGGRGLVVRSGKFGWCFGPVPG